MLFYSFDVKLQLCQHNPRQIEFAQAGIKTVPLSALAILITVFSNTTAFYFSVQRFYANRK